MVKLEFRSHEGEKQVLNPESQRWIKASSAKARKLIGTDVCRLYDFRPGYKPKEHQRRIPDRFMKSQYRGVCLSYKQGSGKTITYAAIADAWLEENPDKKVIIVTSGSLRENFLNEYCSFCGKNRKDLLKRFVFISYNYSGVLTRLPDLKNSLIIIDEVHNILNAKHNSSEIVSELYDRIDESGSRVVVGSGTIVVSHVDELYYLCRLIKPEAFKSLEHFYSFLGQDDEDIIKPNNNNAFLKRLSGVIDYMKVITDDDETEVNYPTVDIEDVYVDIDDDEERLERIVHWRNHEMEIRRPANQGKNPEIIKAMKTASYLAASLMHSRQTSNFLYPSLEDAPLLKNSKTLERTIPEEQGDRRLQDETIDNGGWIDPETIFEVLPHHGEKIYHILEDILQLDGKHVVYTSFRSYYGEKLIMTLLRILNIPCLTFVGDMDDTERAETLRKFNSDDNVDGSEYKVLVMTDAAAEGITLLAVRYQHILEQSISEYIIEQVMGRCNRYRSHNQLPEDERLLTIKRYFLDVESVFPRFKNSIYSPDVVAYERGQQKKKSISYIVEKIIPRLKIE